MPATALGLAGAASAGSRRILPPSTVLKGAAALALLYLLLGIRSLDDINIQRRPQRRKDCRSEFPGLQNCSDLPRSYIYRSPQGALNEMKKKTDIRKLSLHNPDFTRSGPCPGQGSHYNVRHQGRRYGSITCCPCCRDTGQPVEVERCRIVY